MKNYPTFESLLLFSELMQSGSLTRTAAAQGMPVSTASRHLAALRDFFDDPLFSRSRQGLLPTQKARTLLPAVQSLLSQFGSLRKNDGFDLQEISREVRIGCVDNAPKTVFPNVAQEIAKAAPNICICVYPLDGNRFELLRRERLDLIISPVSAAPSKNFHFLCLSPQRYAIVCSPEHPLYKKHLGTGEPAETEELLKYRFVDIVFNQRSVSTLLRASVFPEIADAKSAIKSCYFLSFTSVMMNSDFLMVLPEKTALFFQRTENAAILPTAASSVVHRPKMIWHDTTHADPVMQWVRAMIYSSASSEKKDSPA